MIKLNRKIKFVSYMMLSSSFTLFGVNQYKKNFREFEIDLNKLDFNKNIENKVIEEDEEDPFELIRNFDVDNYFNEKLNVALYNAPLTNKLYPKSNLYGHELIRYFDK